MLKHNDINHNVTTRHKKYATETRSHGEIQESLARNIVCFRNSGLLFAIITR